MTDHQYMNDIVALQIKTHLRKCYMKKQSRRIN